MIAGSAGPGPVPSIWSRWRDSCGEAHLTLDAVVAHVDGELAPGPAQRATEHVQRCLLCAAEVAAQRRTRGLLREADAPGAPSGLLSALRAIPDVPAAPTSPAGLGPGRSPDGGRDDGAVDGPDDSPVDDHGDGPGVGTVGRGRRRRGERGGLRRGLPVAVASGIALGSVALAAVPALPMTSPIARSVAPGSPAGRGFTGADAFAVLSHRAGGAAATGGGAAPTAATAPPAAPVPAVPTTTAPPAAAPTGPSGAGH